MSWATGKGDYIVCDLAGVNIGFSPRGDGTVDVLIRTNEVEIRFEMMPDAVTGLRDFLEAAAKRRGPDQRANPLMPGD